VCGPPCRTLLELGSGGGNNAAHLSEWFKVTLVDISPEMISVSQQLNPGSDHYVGDMRTVRLGETYDTVFVHDAVAYMTTSSDLSSVMRTAAVHCRPGGAALFVPNYVSETFSPSTRCGGNNSLERGLRFVEWTWDPDPQDTMYVVDYAYILREQHEVRVETDRHVEGLFSRNEWLRLLHEADFEPRSLYVEHSHVPAKTEELFLCRRL
jgi:SAM-dependent methyltransferase